MFQAEKAVGCGGQRSRDHWVGTRCKNTVAPDQQAGQTRNEVLNQKARKH